MKLWTQRSNLIRRAHFIHHRLPVQLQPREQIQELWRPDHYMDNIKKGQILTRIAAGAVLAEHTAAGEQYDCTYKHSRAGAVLAKHSRAVRLQLARTVKLSRRTACG